MKIRNVYEKRMTKHAHMVKIYGKKKISTTIRILQKNYAYF